MPNNIYNNLSDRELRSGFWYVIHRVLLRKIFIFCLAVVSAGLLIYGLVGLIDYYIIGRPERLALQADLAKPKLDQQMLAELGSPKPLEVSETLVIKTGAGNVDFVAEILNPNVEWRVKSFDYHYKFGDGATNVKSEFILPGQHKYALYLNYQSAAALSSAELVIENIQWEKAANYAGLEEKALQFDYQNKTVISSKTSGLSGQTPVANVRFDILNKSAFNFWEPAFVVLVRKDNKLMAITKVVLDSLNSGEQKTESINFFQAIPYGAIVEIAPDIDILNQDVFKGFGAGSGELK